MAGAHGSQISRDLQWGDSTGFGAGSQHLGHFRPSSLPSGLLLHWVWSPCTVLPFAPAHLTSGQPMCRGVLCSHLIAGPQHLYGGSSICTLSACFPSAWVQLGCVGHSGRGPCPGDLRVTVTAAPSPCSVPLRPFMTLLFLLLPLPLVQTLGDRPPCPVCPWQPLWAGEAECAVMQTVGCSL